MLFRSSCATNPTWPDRVAAWGVPPSTRIAPAVGGSRPTISCSRVVLPAPFGPTRPTIAPSGTASVQSRSAPPSPVPLGERLGLQDHAVEFYAGTGDSPVTGGRHRAVTGGLACWADAGTGRRGSRAARPDDRGRAAPRRHGRGRGHRWRRGAGAAGPGAVRRAGARPRPAHDLR